MNKLLIAIAAFCLLMVAAVVAIETIAYEADATLFQRGVMDGE